VLGSAACEFRDVFRGATATHRRLRDHLVTIIVATAGVDVLCAIAGFLLERHAQQTEIKTFGSAVFWTTTQLLTVSSQIKNPISVGGRILDVFMEIYAITVIAGLAGAIGSFLQKRGQEIDEKR
jgi:hypothetical protein